MKLVIAIIHKDDASETQSHLTKAGLQSTRLSTSGGFLRAGNVTLLVGVEDARVPDVMDVLRDCCSQRTEIVTSGAGNYSEHFFASPPVQVTVGGATVFVLDVEQFIKM